MIAHPVGRAWSALVEVWPPASEDGAEAQVVPFNTTAASEKLAQTAGRQVAIRWLEREAKQA